MALTAFRAAGEAPLPKRLFGLGSLSAAAVSPDGRHLATGGESAAYLWDLESGTVRHRLPDHRTEVLALAFSPDSTRLVTVARFGSIIIWSVETGARLKTLKGHLSDANSVTFSSDGTRFLTASADNNAVIWSTETGELLQRFTVRGSPLNKAVFSPDATMVATADASPTNNVRIWNAKSGELIRVLGGTKARYPPSHSWRMERSPQAVQTGRSVSGT